MYAPIGCIILPQFGTGHGIEGQIQIDGSTNVLIDGVCALAETSFKSFFGVRSTDLLVACFLVVGLEDGAAGSLTMLATRTPSFINWLGLQFSCLNTW
jgi:hypothetical protein